MRAFILGWLLGSTYGYVYGGPPCNRTYLASVATFQRLFPQLEWTNRATGRGTPGRLYASPILSLWAKGAKELAPPAWTGETRGESSPLPGAVIVADESSSTKVSRKTDAFSSFPTSPRPKEVARGFVLGPLTRGRVLSSISQADTDRLGR